MFRQYTYCQERSCLHISQNTTEVSICWPDVRNKIQIVFRIVADIKSCLVLRVNCEWILSSVGHRFRLRPSTRVLLKLPNEILKYTSIGRPLEIPERTTPSCAYSSSSYLLLLTPLKPSNLIVNSTTDQPVFLWPARLSHPNAST